MVGAVALSTCTARPGSVRAFAAMSAEELLDEHLDVYDTRDGLSTPEHGEIDLPDGWELLPSGDTFVTRRVKAAGRYWNAWLPRASSRRHRRKLGIFAPSDAIQAAHAAAEQTAAKRENARKHGEASRARAEEKYQGELEEAIVAYLDFAEEHAGLAREIAAEASRRAAVVGSGRVGRTRTLGLEQRAELAARAYIRHELTDYEDDLVDLAVWDDDYLYREVKCFAHVKVDNVLARHRRS